MTMMTNEELAELLALDKRVLPPDGGPHFNRLIFCTSPYLLQHARNPVAWRPWDDDAFRLAATEDKPVFLSIGYATCHWCHVMAEESFADQEVADILNRRMIAIKVDREERPDIDEHYMTVSQILTGSGGWPLNLFLLPDKQAFFAFTYLPRRSRGGGLGFIEVVEQVAELWRTDRARLQQNCAAIRNGLGRLEVPLAGALPEAGLYRTAFRQLADLYDVEEAGFGHAPKFPMPVYHLFLLRYAHFWQNEAAGRMVLDTLRRLRSGGIWDQVGGGLHRYSVDRQWLVPHFEKMLYDQALLACTAYEAYQATGALFCREMADELCAFVAAELTSPEGGCYAALDADSEGEEGTYYLWTAAEFQDVLGEDAAMAGRLFGVSAGGNFEGRNILHLPQPPEVVAAREGLSPAELAQRLASWRALLARARTTRIRPLRDEKIVAAWNGLMIVALAKGYAVTGNPALRLAAEQAVAFVAGRLTSTSGRLQRSWHAGVCSGPAFLEDYAFVTWGLVELYQATLDPSFLAEAVRLADEMLRLFSAAGHDGLHETGSDAADLPTRGGIAHDGVMPSSMGIAASCLLRIGLVTGSERLHQRGESLVRAFMGRAASQPVAYLSLLAAALYQPATLVELTLLGGRDSRLATELLGQIGRHYQPTAVVRVAGQEDGAEPAVAVCLAGACRPPVRTGVELAALLELLPSPGH
jgi:uncharacterized protein YyaL (SSP411 family)